MKSTDRIPNFVAFIIASVLSAASLTGHAVAQNAGANGGGAQELSNDVPNEP